MEGKNSAVGWPYFDPEYENFSERMNPPRVVIDNQACDKCTLVKVDSANKHGILLEVVQVLTDLDLIIYKAYISSDGGWFMDVFHVTDQFGNKIVDAKLIEYIQQALGVKRSGENPEVKTCLGRTVGVESIAEHTAIELTGTDRPGLLSEIFALLTALHCNVVAAQVWTHNRRVACLVYVTDESTGSGPIQDANKLSTVKEQLSNVLKGNDDGRGVKTDFSVGLTHTERRLHQLMFADRDYERSDPSDCSRPRITIENCVEKGYSVVNIRCNDRPKLLFDTVCTLTDMQYVVFHATVTSEGPWGIQEYYIRHMDGCTLDTEGERQRVINCLSAAIERRACEGTRLELCTSDKFGLLSEITRLFRENGLTVIRADAYTEGNRVMDEFYVTDSSGGPVNTKVIDAVRAQIGHVFLKASNLPSRKASNTALFSSRSGFSFGSLIKMQWERFSSNLGLIKS